MVYFLMTLWILLFGIVAGLVQERLRPLENLYLEAETVMLFFVVTLLSATAGLYLKGAIVISYHLLWQAPLGLIALMVVFLGGFTAGSLIFCKLRSKGWIKNEVRP